MTARQQAIEDIRKELSSRNKCFLAFWKELDPIMDSLVINYIQEQNKL